MSIKTIIVEDNDKIRDTLRLIIGERLPQIKIIGESEEVEDAYHKICTLMPDLVIFDIDIHDGTSFDILKKIKANGKIDFKFFFLTAHDTAENSIKAIKYSAHDFLVKPPKISELVETINNVCAEIRQKKDFNENLDLLMNLLANPLDKDQVIAIQGYEKIIYKLKIADIVYLEGNGQSTRFHLANESQITGNKNIGHYGIMLCQSFDFIQIDQGLVVNNQYITSFRPSRETVYLSTNQTLKSSRSGTKNLRQYLLKTQPRKLNEGLVSEILEKLKRK